MKGFIGLFLAVVAPYVAAELPTDPLNSAQWPAMYRGFLQGTGEVVFDERVKVHLPVEAEDPMKVPVTVQFDGLESPQSLIVLIDFNPIPRALHYEFTAHMRPFLGFSVRLQQSTPIRVAVKDGLGTWRVNGAWVRAAGGGCTLPSAGRSLFDPDTLLDLRARHWPLDGDGARLRFRLVHPMDTGLVGNTPAYFVEQIAIKNAAGDLIAQLSPFEPISENPLFTVEMQQAGGWTLEGRDNHGMNFREIIR